MLRTACRGQTSILMRRAAAALSTWPNRGDSPSNAAQIGKTIETIRSSLPTVLQSGSLPSSILSDYIRLEVLPMTLAVPEIHGKSAYLTLSKVVTWSVLTLFPDAVLVVESLKPAGDRVLVVRFHVESAARERLTTGLSHFHLDAVSGLVVRHVYEVKSCSPSDEILDRSSLIDWILGRRDRHGQLLPQIQNMEKKVNGYD